jgi:hypothetical protein
MPIQLGAIPQLSAIRPKLESLGYTTFEGVQEVTRIAPDLLSAFVGQPVVPLLASVLSAGAPPPTPVPKYPLGVNLAAIPQQTSAFAHLAGVGAPPPPSANNIALMGPVRNQGDRFTCVGFSSCAALEAYVARQNGGALPAPESPQYLYYECKQNDGDPTGPGTFVEVAFKLLASNGVCLETTWPYDPVSDGKGPPPVSADAEARLHKIPGYVALAPTSVVEVQTQLAGGVCIPISIPVFASWYGSAAVMASGAITLPIPSEVPIGGHAVCLVGYRVDASCPGGGVFVFRNSWGTNWGESCPDGPGYGTLPFEYLAAYGREAYCIQS